MSFLENGQPPILKMASPEHTRRPMQNVAGNSREAYDASLRELLFSGTDLDDMIFYGEDWRPSER